MGNIALWLGAMAAPLVARVLIALGLQVVTITGFTAAIGAIKSIFIARMLEIPAAGFQLAMLAGCGTAFGMIFGAIAFRLVLWTIENSTRILGKT